MRDNWVEYRSGTADKIRDDHFAEQRAEIVGMIAERADHPQIAAMIRKHRRAEEFRRLFPKAFPAPSRRSGSRVPAPAKRSGPLTLDEAIRRVSQINRDIAAIDQRHCSLVEANARLLLAV